MDMPSNCGPIKFSAKVDSSLLAQVQKIIERHKVMEWDGFRGKPNLEILDGNSCGLSAVYASVKKISAYGDDVFLKNYGGFKSDVFKLRNEAVRRYRSKGIGYQAWRDDTDS